MKKRLFSILLILCLLLTAFPFAAQSSPDIIIVAINDTVPFSINEAAMPFVSSDRLYLPYSVFNNAALGVIPSYDSTSRTLTLSNQTKKLSFLLDEGTVKDSDGTESNIPAIIRFGIMFVPAEYCTAYFGISLSYLTSQGGYPVVRLKTGDEVYSDSLFIEKAENLIAYRLSQYIPSDGEPVKPPEIDPTPENPPVNDDPDVPPDEEEPPIVVPDPTVPKYVYAICGASESFLDRLDNSSYSACFLLTPEQIAEAPDLVRHILGCGYTFGFDLRGAENTLDTYREANKALEEAFFFRTALVLCDEAQRESLREAGILAFSPVENPPEVGASLLLFTPYDAFAELYRLSGEKAELSYLKETTELIYPEETPPETTEEP